MVQVETPTLAVRVDLDLRSQNTMREHTKAYRHLLVERADGLNLEWIRVQTGCRSLTATIGLMIRIICTPEGLSFIKNHPMSPTHHKPRSAREMLMEMREAKAANDREKVGAAVAARNIKDEN